MPANRPPQRFTFRVPLENFERGGIPFYAIRIPEDISLAIGRRGPVPVAAILNGKAEVQASLVPMGGGRHRLQLNARTREELGVQTGDPIRVRLEVPDQPPVMPLPADFAAALREADLMQIFTAQPAGKQNHIITWIAEAVRPETRAKRIGEAIQFAFRTRERAFERRKKTGD